MLPHPYALADVASFAGPLETGIIAYLTRDGQTVARVVDEGDRGPILWQWRTRGRALQDHEDALDAYLDDLPPLVTKRISVPEWCPDALIDQLRREASEIAWMLPYCEHHTVLLVMGIDGWGRWRVLDEAYEPRRAQELAAHHGALMVLNEHPDAAAYNAGPAKDAGRARRKFDRVAAQ